MEPLQFALFFSGLVIAYVLVHIRLVRFEEYLRKIAVLEVLQDRFEHLTDNLAGMGDRLEEGLRQLHEDLLEVRELERKIERGQTAVRDAAPAAAAVKTSAAIRSVVEERLLHLGYHNLRILTDLKNVSLDDEVEVLVECEKREMPCKGRVTTINGSVSDVQIHSVAQSFP